MVPSLFRLTGHEINRKKRPIADGECHSVSAEFMTQTFLGELAGDVAAALKVMPAPPPARVGGQMVVCK